MELLRIILGWASSVYYGILFDDYLLAIDDIDAWKQGANVGHGVGNFYTIEVVDGLAGFARKCFRQIYVVGFIDDGANRFSDISYALGPALAAIKEIHITGAVYARILPHCGRPIIAILTCA